MIEITDFLDIQHENNRFEKQIKRLVDVKHYKIERFQKVVDKAIENINSGIKSFVIYGAPQSGKTEMMILLTAKLLDNGNKIIIVLLNDNVELLTQNLNRFSDSGLNPTPKDVTEVIDPIVHIGDQEWVIFCKKDSSDLQKLIEKLGDKPSKIIIDDEGDYATPNSKINKDDQTKINQLVETLLSSDGVYIGVTATPARLDLNNTFHNVSTHWICFEPHEKHTGQDVFFPITTKAQYNLELLPDEYDDPKYLREALLRFFVNVAILNLRNKNEQNYSMLVHTSGFKADHTEDYKQIIDTLNILGNRSPEQDFNGHLDLLHEIAMKKSQSEDEAKKIIMYILENVRRNKVVIMNSNSERKKFGIQATNPIALFTIAIGGNIVSRGMTFENLLSMFFTRDVKHKIQQDTYIQRARMFGSRGDYLKHFELTIPGKLYLDWHTCFIYHRLSLQSAIDGNTPVWFSDKRVQPVAGTSIDKTTVAMHSGEMGFAIFNYSNGVEEILNGSQTSFEVLDNLRTFLGDACIPKHLVDFIQTFSHDGTNSLAIHSSMNITNYKDADQENIIRKRGFIGDSEMEQQNFPHAIHHIKIFFNSENKRARVYYRCVTNIKFLKRVISQ